MDALAATVLSTLALKGVLNEIAPELRVRFDATQALLKAIAAGESADLVILTTEAVDELHRQGKVARGVTLGASGVGVAVRAGAPRPDVGTVEKLKASLLAAESVAHSKVGASGLYFAQLLKELGIAERLKRIVVVEKGPVGAVVASGGAQIGVQQLCELAPVPGIDIVGGLPAPVQRTTQFSAAVMEGAKHPAAAQALVELLLRQRATLQKHRIDPP
jgi:molybdate transport system substrate-binding protein